MTVTVLQTADKALRGLPPDHLAVALAGMAQDRAEQMRALAFAIRHDPRTLSKIHLGLGSRLHLHPHKGHGLGRPQMPHKSFYRLITARETVITNQVLIN